MREADDGDQDWSGTERYQRAFDRIATRSDVVAYPSYFGDHSHVWALAARAPGGPGSLLASYDVAQEVVGPRLWNERACRFEDPPFDTVGGEQPADPLGDMRRVGVTPTVNVFDVGEARWLALAIRAGMFPTPLYVKLFLCEQLVTGPFADERGIDAYLSQLPPELDLECTIVPYTMMDAGRSETLLRAALRTRPARARRASATARTRTRRPPTRSSSPVRCSWCATPGTSRRRRHTCVNASVSLSSSPTPASSGSPGTPASASP